MRGRTTVAAGVVAAGAVAAGLLVAAAAGAAEGDPLRVEVRVGESAEEGDLTLAALRPGAQSTATVIVRNDAAAGRTLTVQVVDVRDDEAGCSPAEALVDTTCGQGEGDLSEWLTVAVAADDLGTSFAGTADHLAERQATFALPPQSAVEVDLAVSLDERAGNETMTDRLAMTLLLGAADAAPEVGGVTFERPRGGELPRTGEDLGALATAGAGLVAGGLLLLRRRRRRASAPGPAGT